MEVIVSARPGADASDDDRMPFTEMLARADIVTLHCPLTDDTRGLFGADQFAAMKPNALLINTARGALIDSPALVAALEGGRIAGAAIDVLAKEPPVDGDPLLDYTGDNLIVTPHIAWAAREARQRALEQIAQCIESFAGGGNFGRVV